MMNPCTRRSSRDLKNTSTSLIHRAPKISSLEICTFLKQYHTTTCTCLRIPRHANKHSNKPVLLSSVSRLLTASSLVKPVCMCIYIKLTHFTVSHNSSFIFFLHWRILVRSPRSEGTHVKIWNDRHSCF